LKASAPAGLRGGVSCWRSVMQRVSRP